MAERRARGLPANVRLTPASRMSAGALEPSAVGPGHQRVVVRGWPKVTGRRSNSRDQLGKSQP